MPRQAALAVGAALLASVALAHPHFNKTITATLPQGVELSLQGVIGIRGTNPRACTDQRNHDRDTKTGNTTGHRASSLSFQRTSTG